jgi:general secretion pathway protein L
MGFFMMLREILVWWLRQLRALLPDALLQDSRRRDALLVTLHGPAEFSVSLRRRRRETDVGAFSLDSAGEQRAKAAIRRPIRYLALRPDPVSVLRRHVTLPLAAEHDLEHVLRYEMDRLTPFAAEQVFWSANIDRRDRVRGRLELSLSLLPKTLLLPVFAAFERLGLKFSAIETTHRDGTFCCIDLTPHSARQRRLLSFACGAFAVLALAVVATPFVMQSLARGTVEAGIAALQPQVTHLEALRRRIAAGSAGTDVIASERAKNGDALQLLATVTDLLPDDTVLSELSLRQGKLSISGRSRFASQLIPAMANDPVLHNPSFAAPVTRTPDGKADTFVIRAELNP